LSNEFTIRFPLAPAYVDALFASAGVTPTAAERTVAIRIAALRSVKAFVTLIEYRQRFGP
jgi:hypothetical protein